MSREGYDYVREKECTDKWTEKEDNGRIYGQMSREERNYVQKHVRTNG